MSTLTTNFQFVLPSINNPIDANIWGGQLNGDLTSLDGFLTSIDTANISPTAPVIPATAAPAAGMLWINNSSGVGGVWPLQVYDGSFWLTIGMINSEDHIFSGTGVINGIVQTFATAGTFTYTPSFGMSFCIVEVVGGGGGSGGVTAGNPGAGSAAGGGGGGYAKQIFTAAQIGTSQPLVVGAAGAASSSGGSTLFGNAGALLNVTGGSGSATQSGVNNASNVKGSIGGIGGVSVGNLGFLNVPGTRGENGLCSMGSTPFAFGGNGGANALGGGGLGYCTTTIGDQGNGLAGITPGSGAGGASSLFVTGGASGTTGAAGIVIITEYI